jgi:type IV pilus assembly protein PilA
MRRLIKSRRGFTLVEIVLVIAIIIILASVTALSVADILNRQKAASTSVQNAVSSAKENISVRENKLSAYGF